MAFKSLGLSAPILKAIEQKGYSEPSPIQAQAIPAILDGNDVMAAAQTGTGKTAGFTLPLLERLATGPKTTRNEVRALVLTPTRELAAQVHESIETYGKHLPLKSAVVFGGVKINPQMMRLRSGVDVLVATPGRLLDLYNHNALRFTHLEVLVLDEADRMLDMGFIHDLKKIIALLPNNRQNLLFSATFSDDIRRLAKNIVNNPVEISVTPRNAAAKSVEQIIHTVDKKRKAALLTELIQSQSWRQVLVFTKTKRGANQLTKHLEGRSITAAAIHGNKSQGARTKALANFKNGTVRVLVATDIAARGLDIDQLPQVVNFDLPNVAEDYVHRIGRTGRAGSTGHAISLVSADEAKLLQDIECLIQQEITRVDIDGFEPMNTVPRSRIKPLKPKRPKKPRDQSQQASRDGSQRAENNQGQRPSNNRNRSNNNQGGEPQNNRRRNSNNNGPAKSGGHSEQGQSKSRNGNRAATGGGANSSAPRRRSTQRPARPQS